MTFEGIDGSGKTTVSKRTFDAIRSRGERVVLTAEPTASWLGDAVRRSVEVDAGALVESFLFFADRAAHLREIRAALARGEIVLCDRYADSTYAYQGARLEGKLTDPIAFLRRIGEPWVLKPDLTILIRVPAEVGMKRLEGRARRIRFEDAGFLRKVAANYDTLAKDKGFTVLDGGNPLEVVVDEAVRAIEAALTPSPGRA